MMRQLMIVGGLAGSIVAPGQAGFIYRLDTAQANYGAEGRSVVEVPDGYLIFGHQITPFQGANHNVIFKIDTLGHYVWRKEIAVGDTFQYAWGELDPVCVNDTGAIVGCSHRYSYLHDDSWLFWMNSDGDTVRSRLIGTAGPLDSVAFTHNCIRPSSDGGYLLGGWREREADNTLSKAYVTKCNSLGDTLWSREYSSPNTEFLGEQIASFPDGGAVLTGQRLQSFIMNDGFVLRIGSNGAEKWRQYYGNAAESFNAVRVTSAGEVVSWSLYREFAWPADWAQFMLTKWDSLGSMVWQRRSHYSYSNYTKDFELLPDGSFITCGELNGSGCLAKFNSNGDSLWTRKYQVTNALHELYDVRPTSDGGFITTGKTGQHPPDPFPGLTTIWGFKTDSLGCVVPGCQLITGVEEYLLDLNELLTVSPDPTQELVHLELHLPQGFEPEGAVRVLLLNAAGQVVHEQQGQRNLDRITSNIDVSTLPAGIYFVHLADARRWLAGSKVVVQ